MPSERSEPLFDSHHLLDMAADVLSHDDAIRIVRRLHTRFPCIEHDRIHCTNRKEHHDEESLATACSARSGQAWHGMEGRGRPPMARITIEADTAPVEHVCNRQVIHDPPCRCSCG
jgi:hypothetical protein